MKKNHLRSIKRSLIFIDRYRRKYGLKIALRALHHYAFRVLKNKQVNPNESIVTVHGYEMVLMPNDPGISTELAMFGTHEPINTKIICRLLKKGMNCIDIGGNIGYYVFLERKLVGDTGKILAFEPSPRNYNYLKKNIELQNFKNILIYNFACGDSDGTSVFFINEKSNGGKIITTGVTPPDPSRGSLTKVPIRILDPIINQLQLEHVDFIRMDAEGFELHILKGLQQTIAKFKPIISLELHKRQLGLEGTKEFFNMMKKFDYRIESYIPRDLDVPFIGQMKDAQKPDIDTLLTSIENDQVSSYLMLNLVSNSK